MTKHRGTQDFISGVQVRGNYFDYSNRPTLCDDFLGDVIEDGWSAAKGSDPQAVIATIQAGAISGAVRLTCGDTTTVAESLSSLTHGLNWRAGNGGLVFEAKVTPVSSVADVSYFVGFTDVLATTTLEDPFSLSGTTYTSNATDAVGFLFDTAATTDVWYGIGVKDGTDSTPVACSAPAAGTAQTLRIEVDAAGHASFFINGVYQGRSANSVTTTVALTPIVSVMARTTAVKSIDCDYVFVQMAR